MSITTPQALAHDRRHRERRSERRMMQRLVILVYPLCLVSAIGMRLAGLFDTTAARAEQSVFAEAKASAYAAIGYAFHA